MFPGRKGFKIVNWAKLTYSLINFTLYIAEQAIKRPQNILERLSTDYELLMASEAAAESETLS